MKNWSWKHKSALVVALTLGIGAASYWHHERNKDVIAWVGEFSITQAEFVKEMHYRGGVFVNELDKQALLDEMIAKKLVLNKAYEMGYHKRADVRREYEYLLMGKVNREFVEKKREMLTLDKLAVNKHYGQHRDDYRIPQKDQFAILFFKKRHKQSSGNAMVKLNAIKQLADANKLSNNAKDGFGEYAISNSEHQVSRYKGGDIGWFSKGKDVHWENTVLDAGFALKQVGDVSSVVETDKGYYLVRLMEREEAQYRSLASVEDRIRHKLILTQQKAVKDNFNQQLKNSFSISVNNEKLDAVGVENLFAKDTKQTIPSLGVLN